MYPEGTFQSAGDGSWAIEKSKIIEELIANPKEILKIPEGIKEENVDIVMYQTCVSRNIAIKMLLKTKGDIPTAILEIEELFGLSWHPQIFSCEF